MKIFDETLNWYKGNTHMHTTLSDGRLAPEEAIARYAAKGYDFVTLTDHRRISPERREQGLLVLSGTELDYGFANQVVHITALGLERAFDTQAACDERAGAGPEAGIAAIRAAGGRAILAHPCWSLNTQDMLERLDGISALEIYNTVSGTPWNADRAESASFSDVASANGRIIPVVGADDAHFYDGDACQTCIYVNAADCTRRAILEAIDAGRFYATRGPRIEQIEVADGSITVRCSAAQKIIFYSARVWSAGRCHVGEGLRCATHEVNGADVFVRVEVEDAQGRKAYTSPISLR